MRITVCMATHNGARFLDEQLESIASQTRPPDELIISDDHSTDSTFEILRNFAARAPFRVRLLMHPDIPGYARNFNYVLCHSDGDLVCLSDQDDIWQPTKLSTLEKTAERSRALLYIHDFEVINEFGQRLDRGLLPSIRMNDTVDQSVMHGCLTAVDGMFLRAFLPIPQEDTHDHWLYENAQALKGIACIEEPLIFYRVHANSASAESRTSAEIHPAAVRRIIPWFRQSIRSVTGVQSRRARELRALRLERYRIQALQRLEEAGGNACDEKLRNAREEAQLKLRHLEVNLRAYEASPPRALLKHIRLTIEAIASRMIPVGLPRSRHETHGRG